MKRRLILITMLLVAGTIVCFGQNPDSGSIRAYKLLATTKTSTMQKELDEASSQGFRVLVGAPTSESEMVVFLSLDGTVKAPFKYKLLATSRTGTMKKELNEASQGGYRLIPSTILAKKQLFGGVEIVMILELPPNADRRYEYELLATSRTSTLQKEVTNARDAGFKIVGMVSRGEHMVVMEREIEFNP